MFTYLLLTTLCGLCDVPDVVEREEIGGDASSSQEKSVLFPSSFFLSFFIFILLGIKKDCDIFHTSVIPLM